MKKLAHRGYSAYYPENTMEAFIQAYNKGFDGIETDVHMTSDGQLVLIHDEDISRTSNGSGYIKDMTLKQLKQYNFHYKNNGIYEIPTLQELLEYIQDKNIIVNIEIKTDHIHYENIEQKVYEMVESYHLHDKIIYSSFYLPSLLKLQQIDSTLYLGYLMEDHYEERIQQLYDNHLIAIHPRYDYLNKENIKNLKQNNITIATWTVPNKNEYKKLKEQNIDMIISNEYLEGEQYAIR
ncbi:MAG: glycerophosphodiester phosphodiesterase [Erysipelotrichaceae bacterium]|nr:glycerophosphodiester phosphodiesterase [Erysipelotrichaceae bacterium]